MEWFSNWWGTLDIIEQILYCIAIPSSLLLIIQMVLVIVGGDSDVDGGDIDADFGDIDGPSEFGAANLFTLQGVASFFCVFGWVSIFMYRGGISLFIAFPVALVAGFSVMALIAFIMSRVARLAHSGTFEVERLLGKTGIVYLNIPPKEKGRGKVTIQTSERLLEFDAISTNDEGIPNNSQVKVIDILGENTLVVETLELRNRQAIQ